jgi:hypothetical protein
MITQEVADVSWAVPLLRALVAAARAFADDLEQSLGGDDPGGTSHRPAAGTAASMVEVLASVAKVNDEAARGVLDEEMRVIAEAAGMDPRGIAGYYAAGLLEKRQDGTRWILPRGRSRLERLTALQRVHPLSNDHPRPDA